MPDVRRACAALVLGTGSTSPQPNILAAGRSSPRALSLASASPLRHPFAPGAHRVMAPRSPHLITHRHALITGTTDGASLTVHGSSRAFALPVLRLFGSRRSESAFGKVLGIDDGLAMPSFTAPTASGSIPAPQRTCEAAPGPVPRSSANAAILNPPRTHSVAPNPGMQRTRYARR